MKYTVNWRVIVLWVSCLLLGSVYCLSTALSYTGEVVIVNSAANPIENGQLEVCGQKLKFGKLARGKSTVIQYKVKSDSHFKILVEFSSLKKMSRELGYVTNGRNFEHVLTLTDDDASIELR